MLKNKNFKFYKLDIGNKNKLDNFLKNQIDIVFNLRMHVRYSYENPKS